MAGGGDDDDGQETSARARGGYVRRTAKAGTQTNPDNPPQSRGNQGGAGIVPEGQILVVSVWSTGPLYPLMNKSPAPPPTRRPPATVLFGGKARRLNGWFGASRCRSTPSVRLDPCQGHVTALSVSRAVTSPLPVYSNSCSVRSEATGDRRQGGGARRGGFWSSHC